MYFWDEWPTKVQRIWIALSERRHAGATAAATKARLPMERVTVIPDGAVWRVDQHRPERIFRPIIIMMNSPPELLADQSNW